MPRGPVLLVRCSPEEMHHHEPIASRELLPQDITITLIITVSTSNHTLNLFCHHMMNACRRLSCACRGPIGLRAFLLGSKLNVLLFICGPLAFISDSNHWGEGASFVLAMLAIAPLAERLGFLTEQIAMHTNDTFGGMLNATFGNSVETLISIMALIKAQQSLAKKKEQDAQFFLTLVQTSLLGSMLSNLLLVQGSAFFLGGLRHPMQSFSREGAVTSAGLLVLATLALSIPSMLFSRRNPTLASSDELGLSRFVSMCLLIIYSCFVVFQLRTHRFLFERVKKIHRALDLEEHEKLLPVDPSTSASLGPVDHEFQEVKLSSPTCTIPAPPQFVIDSVMDEDDIQRMSAVKDHPSNKRIMLESVDEERVDFEAQIKPSAPTQAVDTEEGERPQIGFFFAVLYLIVCTVGVALVSSVVVEAAEGAVQSLQLNPLFIGGVVVPIVGNAAEHTSALMFAWRDKMDTALAIAVGSAIQIPLFVLPVCVMVGWMMNVPMSLNVHQFMMTIVVVTSLALAFTLHAGSSHWLHGLILMFEYAIVASSFWFSDQ